MNTVRIDKWLWAARFFKTRALASKACDLGRVQLKGVDAKPAREVKTGDRLQIRTEGGLFEIDILEVSEVRGPAAVAQSLYSETEASKEARAREAAERKTMREILPMPVPSGRPNNRDRRHIIQFRGGR